MPPGQALVKEGFFNFLKNSLLSAIGPDTRQRDSFAECLVLTLGKEAPLSSAIFDTRQTIFFTFDLQTFSIVLRQYMVLHVPMWHISRTFLYFFNLFHLIEFSWIIQIITTSHSNNEKMNGKMIFMLFSIM